ncbi:metallophosphoesterase family protein [Trinickia dinghuensis]|uniref:Phosphoesterase n=1 Tax=Trinickia dinghuensis TaxID=2291023 RepID=A0A3D8JYP7_9BURK|nr:metallophosphoesterase family protein [Trinickia dinghuensis]RDU97942.1 metallophosphoesterase [Trinickia dinghuensis]
MPSARNVVRIGLISDTHNLVRPEALAWLAGVDAIVHAGDICQPDVLEALARIAPVTAVRGNNDHGAWADELPVATTLTIGGAAIHVVHDIADLDIDASAQRIDAVVTGHSHKPSIVTRDGVLFVNPGSAGPRRFKLPVSAGRLIVEQGRVRAELHTLVA